MNMRIIDALNKALKGIARETAVIPTDKITFSQHVLDACALNHCGKYNTCWTCPPAVGDIGNIEKKYRKFSYAFVFTTMGMLEDSFDIEGMDKAREEHIKAERKALDAISGFNYDWLTAGSCGICAKCTYPDAPCVFPERARPSVEACGIDVVTLAKTCGISYYNGEGTVTYFSIIFFNDV